MPAKRLRQPAASLSPSGTSALLRLAYWVVPKHVANRILPPNASLTRQAATLYAASFVVGAGMEMFMIKTGFYDVATRKEAERRAMAQWEREEAGRVQEQRALERARREAEREKQDLQHYRKRLVEELTTLRCKEQAEGVKLNDEKARVKLQLRDVARQLESPRPVGSSREATG